MLCGDLIWLGEIPLNKIKMFAHAKTHPVETKAHEKQLPRALAHTSKIRMGTVQEVLGGE